MKSAYELNKAIERIENSKLTPVTDYAFIQQAFPIVVRPSNVAGNRIMTYKESIERQAKVSPNSTPFTYEEYKNELENLQSQYGDRFSVRGEKQVQRDYMLSYINDYKEQTNEDFNSFKFENVSTSKLIEAFRYARENYKSVKSKYDSKDMFMASVYEYLKGEIS